MNSNEAATLERLTQIIIAAWLADHFALAGPAARAMDRDVLWDLACLAVRAMQRG